MSQAIIRRGPSIPLEADDPAEIEVQRELRRLGIKNSPRPLRCPKCQSELKSTSGMVGEELLLCLRCGDIVWEDSEDAIRRVF